MFRIVNKRILLLVLVLPLLFAGCDWGPSDADIAAKNLSIAAEQFEIPRHIVGINGITDKYLFEVVGYCSLETSESALGGTLEATCRVVDEKTKKVGYKKAFLGLSDNVTFVMEDIEPTQVSTTRYRVIFKPEALIPNFDRP